MNKFNVPQEGSLLVQSVTENSSAYFIGMKGGYLAMKVGYTELLFKKMKQNFQLRYFYGENENTIRTQVWYTLIAQLLMTVIQKKAQTKKAFSVVASLVRIHLISMFDLNELLRSSNRAFKKQTGDPPNQLQLNWQ